MAAGSSPRESHPCIPHAALLIPQQELWWRNGYFFECHFEIFLNKGKECYVTNQELIQKLRCEKGYKQP